MKNVLSSCSVALAILLSSLFLGAPAFANEPRTVPASFWLDVSDLITECAVSPYAFSGTVKTYGALRSKCPEIEVKDGQATFTLGGKYRNEIFVATIQDSEDSDGGDLVDLIVRDSSGKVIAEHKSILAFRDVLLALAGGKVHSEEVYDSSLFQTQ